METPKQTINYTGTESSEPQRQPHGDQGADCHPVNLELVDLEQLSLPKEIRGFLDPTLYFYSNFWCPSVPLRYLISSETSSRPFQAQDTDIIVAGRPKSGTTWFKALLFCVVNREKYPIISTSGRNSTTIISQSQLNHPLLTAHPLFLVPPLEHMILDPEHSLFHEIYNSLPPRLYSTHIPHHALPESIKISGCKIIYMYRNPLDNLVSMWHFACRNAEGEEESSRKMEMIVDSFCKGTDGFGPHWDHVLGYWRKSLQRPHKVLFMRFENLKVHQISEIKRFAEFIGYPFTSREEDEEVIEEIAKLCSIESLKNMKDDTNTEKRPLLVTLDKFFRKGEVGDWVNHLSPSMVDRVRAVVQGKFNGTGFEP